MAIGYIALDDWTPFRKLYAYMDTADICRADGLFHKHRVRVRFKRDWLSPDGRYRIVFCSVPKKQIPLFEEAMAEFNKCMVILGYDDYEECWRKILQLTESAAS